MRRRALFVGPLVRESLLCWIFLSSSPTVFDSLCISVGDVGLVGTRSTEAFPCHFCLFVCFFLSFLFAIPRSVSYLHSRASLFFIQIYSNFYFAGEVGQGFSLKKKKKKILPSAGKSRIMFDIELRLPVIGSSCRFNERPNISDRQMAKK